MFGTRSTHRSAVAAFRRTWLPACWVLPMLGCANGGSPNPNTITGTVGGVPFTSQSANFNQSTLYFSDHPDTCTQVAAEEILFQVLLDTSEQPGVGTVAVSQVFGGEWSCAQTAPAFCSGMNAGDTVTVTTSNATEVAGTLDFTLSPCTIPDGGAPPPDAGTGTTHVSGSFVANVCPNASADSGCM
jgi:hypothetical protein